MKGIFNVKGPGEVALSRIFRILGRKPVPVPGGIAEGVLNRLWRYRLTSFPTPATSGLVLSGPKRERMSSQSALIMATASK